MTTTTFTEDDRRVVAEVRKVAAEQPDYHYRPHNDSIPLPRCRYEATDLNPYGCIMGYAFRRLGHPIDNQLGTIGTILRFDRSLNMNISDEVEEWLGHVQSGQDGMGTSRLSWSEAVAKADEQVPEVAELTAAPTSGVIL